MPHVPAGHVDPELAVRLVQVGADLLRRYPVQRGVVPPGQHRAVPGDQVRLRMLVGLPRAGQVPHHPGHVRPPADPDDHRANSAAVTGCAGPVREPAAASYSGPTGPPPPG